MSSVCCVIVLYPSLSEGPEALTQLSPLPGAGHHSQIAACILAALDFDSLDVCLDCQEALNLRDLLGEPALQGDHVLAILASLAAPELPVAAGAIVLCRLVCNLAIGEALYCHFSLPLVFYLEDSPPLI